MAKQTQKFIMSTFMQLLENESLDKITVRDIVEECEINRNTFYYHYSDIYDLLDDVFRVEAEKFLEQDVDDNTTFGEEYARAAQFVLKYRKAILHIYDSKKRDVLENYLETLAFSFINRFVKKESEGYGLSDDDVNYITGFYTHAIVGNTIEWIKRKLPSGQERFIERTVGTFNVTVKDMIEQCVKENKAMN
ncbi:transcriptional regulator TetR family [Firmicutes bacterium CAG:882]|nr:transcriptional regulator TetR family [Firmicutes bacterium CAG:882]